MTIISLVLMGGGLVAANTIHNNLIARYSELKPQALRDRHNAEVGIYRNARGYYAVYIDEAPETFAKLLIKKEDRFFYYHPGINPLSIIRAMWNYVLEGRAYGASTITQQVAKNLLGNELKRTIANKAKESLYALAIELYASKKEIILMYANTAYFGNSMQGVEAASNYYFGKSTQALTFGEILRLLATLSSPSTRYPGTIANSAITKNLASILGVGAQSIAEFTPAINKPLREKETGASFEMRTLGISCPYPCKLTIDQELTQRLREVLYRNLFSPSFQSVKNGAIVVIKLPENELLAVVGSPDPRFDVDGYQINMASEPRPIGSTAKPFFYAKAFEKGIRPYTLVEDRELKYAIGTGFEFYPKNYDGKYRGIVTIHQALSNSLNVPSVQVLEYVGLENFYKFLLEDLGFRPLRPLPNYGLGIALGGLEMDLLTLSHLFTVFGNEGVLKPLTVARNSETPIYLSPPMANVGQAKTVFDKRFIQLINKILSDRITGVDQFGLASQLNLEHDSYALKTGTSRDFHDSWTLGYTPDFLVGVWIGNSDNTPMQRVSGQTGAGKIWHEAMDMILASPYNQNTQFEFSLIEEKLLDGKLEYGLPGDDAEAMRIALLQNNTIIEPHESDVFLLGAETSIPFRARNSVDWLINGAFYANGAEARWYPQKSGIYKIEARGESKTESVQITIKNKDEI
ncbi:MAG: transglycosylase domain-containing protein [bacterium]|nr:transglycosylase domain-containing protein [bacterium]